MNISNSSIDKGALSIAEFCSWTSIGRTLVYKLIKEKQLKPFKVGRRTLITRFEAERWLKDQSMTAPSKQIYSEKEILNGI